MLRCFSLLLSVLLAAEAMAGCRGTSQPNVQPVPYIEEPEPEEEPLPKTETVERTIVTYNVAALGHGGDKTERIAAFLASLDADYVGLNELDSCNSRHNVYQLKVLADRLGGWNCHFASAFDFAGGGYGNGAMTPYPILSEQTIPLAKGSGHEPRSIALIETEDIVFGALHLDFGPPGEPSYDQAVALNDWFNEHYAGYGKPVILVGDFNTDPGTPTQNEMERYWTRLSDPVLSWPTGTATMCLDYVFCLKSAVPVKAVETSRPQSDDDLDELSDHYPVRVKIRYERDIK